MLVNHNGCTQRQYMVDGINHNLFYILRYHCSPAGTQYGQTALDVAETNGADAIVYLLQVRCGDSVRMS